MGLKNGIIPYYNCLLTINYYLIKANNLKSLKRRQFRTPFTLFNNN